MTGRSARIAASLDEEGRHPATLEQRVHLVVGRPDSAAIGGVELLREEPDVAGGVQEDAGPAEDPADGEVDVALLAERLVPGGRTGRALALPRTEGDALDRLDGDAPLCAEREERLGVGRVRGVAQLRPVVGKEHAVEWEPLQASPVLRGSGGAVAGDPDEADETGIARLDRRPQRSVRAHRDLPLGRIDEVVELEKIDVVDAEALERAPDLLPGCAVGPLARLRREEEAVPAAPGEPRREPELRVAVAGGRVEMIEPVADHELERAVRLGLRCARERCRAEDEPAALMPRPAEGSLRDHRAILLPREWRRVAAMTSSTSNGFAKNCTAPISSAICCP